METNLTQRVEQTQSIQTNELNKIRTTTDDYPIVNGYKITGSGVSIIENYCYLDLNNNRHEDLVIILARDGKPNIFSIFGGKLDVGNTIVGTAIEELQQESLNMFNFSKSCLSNCPYITMGGNIVINKSIQQNNVGLILVP